jgi:hypothetical protein
VIVNLSEPTLRAANAAAITRYMGTLAEFKEGSQKGHQW